MVIDYSSTGTGGITNGGPVASESMRTETTEDPVRRFPGSWIVVLLPILIFMVLARSTGHLILGSIGVALSAGLAWRFAGGERGGLAQLGLDRPASWPWTVGEGLVAALGAAVVLALLGGLITTKLGAPDLKPFLTMREHPVELVEWLAIALTTAAFGEEIVFRGFLIPLFSPAGAHGPRELAVGVVVSSVLFGLAHSYQGAGGAVSSGIVGAVFGM